jgi:hypothetical protein
LAVFTKRPFKLDAGIVELDNWIILELQNKVNMYNKSDFATELKNRTKKFAIESIRHFRKLPKTDEARIIGNFTPIERTKDREEAMDVVEK